MDMTYDFRQERRIALSFLLVALLALAAGALPGILQALEHARFFALPNTDAYNLALSLHGILTAIIWTSFFASAFLPIALTRSLGRGLSAPSLSWLAFLLMLAGAALMVYGALTGPTVFYTIDLPMKGSFLYYFGFLVLLIGTWLHSINHFITWQAWKRANPDVRTPLAAYGTLAAWILWDLATLGVIAELVLILLNHSIVNDNPLLGRTLFWYFGNGLEYFALLPAYISWLAMLPRQAGGKLYSERLARSVFILFLVFAIPSGLTRQLTDAGISASTKAIHFALSYGAALPALITAFVTMASLEYSGKSRGAGNLTWPFRLPLGDPSFMAQVLALTALAGASITSVIQNSFNMALVVDGTTFEVGNLHLTLGTAGALTFMGITYWLVPYLTQRRLMSRALGTLQAILWFVGAVLLSRGLHAAGLMDAPRRTSFALGSLGSDLAGLTSGDPMGGFQVAMLFVAIGGIIMTLSGLLYFLVMAGSLLGRKETADAYDVPLAETVAKPSSIPTTTSDRWRVWVSAAIVLILLAYAPLLIDLMR